VGLGVAFACVWWVFWARAGDGFSFSASASGSIWSFGFVPSRRGLKSSWPIPENDVHRANKKNNTVTWRDQGSEVVTVEWQGGTIT